MNTDYQKELTVAKDIAKRAGAVMLQYFNGGQQAERKEDGSLVTIADKEINRLVIQELTKHFDDIIIGEEESTGDYGAGRRWFCDPVDGTRAFALGIPTATFSLGLVVEGVPVLGVVYSPFLNRLYEAIKGQGSYCNGMQLHVSKKELAGEYVAITSSIKKIMERPLYIDKLLEQKARLTTLNGAVYKACLVAQGKLVGYVGERVKPHDIAAAEVIVEESDGKVTDYDGNKPDYRKPFKSVIISNGIVHEKLIECIKI